MSICGFIESKCVEEFKNEKSVQQLRFLNEDLMSQQRISM